MLSHITLSGTQAGDLVVFNLNARVFRAALPILNGGVNGIQVYDHSTLILSGGNGKVKTIRGSDTHWDMIRENILESPCMSIALANDGRELLVRSY